MKHSIHNDWHLPFLNQKKEYFIKVVPDVTNFIFLNNIKPEIINFNDIAYRPFPDNYKNLPRYISANINKFGVLVINMDNPYNKKYRMIDGRHRLMKLMDMKYEEHYFYVLELEQIKKYIRNTD